MIPDGELFAAVCDARIKLLTERRKLLQICIAQTGQQAAVCGKLIIPVCQIAFLCLSELNLFQHGIALCGQLIEPPQTAEHRRSNLRTAKIHEAAAFFRPGADQFPVIR